MLRPLLVYGAAFLAVACVRTNAAVMNPIVTRAAVCEEGVAIFTTPDRVSSKYEEVALLTFIGSDTKMMDSMRKKAGTVGANGIIMGGFLGIGAELSGKSLAIYIPGDSSRVRQACSSPDSKTP